MKLTELCSKVLEERVEGLCIYTLLCVCDFEFVNIRIKETHVT